MKGKTKPAPQVQNAALSAAKVLQQDKENRSNRAMQRINQILQEERCTIDVSVIIRNGQYPIAQMQIIALDPENVDLTPQQ